MTLQFKFTGIFQQTFKQKGWISKQTYTVRAGDDDGAGDETEAVVHAHLKSSFPKTRKEGGRNDLLRKDSKEVHLF